MDSRLGQRRRILLSLTMNENIYRVVRIEEHWLPTCGCPDCVAERERRKRTQQTPSSNSRLRHISVEAALLFGFIPPSSPVDSVASRLRMAGRHLDAPLVSK